ncbi:hypothetical protein ACOME3_003816 [Neoechinorhynchus agilis]
MTEHTDNGMVKQDDEVDRVEEFTREQLLLKVKAQQSLIESLIGRRTSGIIAGNVTENEKRLARCRHQRDVLAYKMALKNKQIEELTSQLDELRNRKTLVDPCVQGAIERMRSEVEECRRSRQAALDEVEAKKFDSSSQIGRSLIEQCTKLMEENDRLNNEMSEQVGSDTSIQIYREIVGTLKAQIRGQQAMLVDLDDELEMLSSACRVLNKAKVELELKNEDDGVKREQAERSSPARGGDDEVFDYDEMVDVVTLSAPQIDDALSQASPPPKERTTVALKNLNSILFSSE